ncbi:hypothetical protein [Cypionkella psychrotolerans]|uniref:hypothetical protein n=1 Tax=Cypionkella psychrotolerans TaxID=1678131 RepID=UPI0006B6445E|nr:hypothetical protein [Cypionkella psychrotolerans]
MGLYLDPEGSFRLKAFSSASRGTKATIKIEVETDDLDDLGFFLGSLARLQEQQKQAVVVKREAAKKPKMLALPKPEPL